MIDSNCFHILLFPSSVLTGTFSLFFFPPLSTSNRFDVQVSMHDATRLARAFGGETVTFSQYTRLLTGAVALPPSM